MLRRTMLGISLPGLLSQHWQLIAFGLVQAFIYLYLFQSGLYGTTLREDFTLDYFYSTQAVLGNWPYRDLAVEYPPLAMLFIILPRLLFSTATMYTWGYTVEMLVFGLTGLMVISTLANELRLSRWKTMGIYTLVTLSTGPLIIYRFDIIPAVLSLLAVYFLIKGHSKTAWAILAIGVLTKIYPVILAPLFLVYQLRRHQSKEAIGGIAAFAVTSIVILLSALILSPEGVWHSFAYHTQRGLQIESTYASILELLLAFKMVTLDFVFSSGSVNVVSPAADVLAQISFGVMVTGLLAVYWFFNKGLKNIYGKQPGNGSEIMLLVNYSLVTLLVFILTSKVFSPQYVIWVLPFIPLVTGKWRNVCWLLFIMAGLMTFFIYPKYYAGIENGELITVGMLVMRNLALSVIAILLAISGNNEHYIEKNTPYLAGEKYSR